VKLPVPWGASLTGGVVASSSLVASVSSAVSAIPPELRGLFGALLAAVLADVVGEVRVWGRRRLARWLGNPDPAPVEPSSSAALPDPVESTPGQVDPVDAPADAIEPREGP
jgi:hypothetical protein